MAQAQRFLFLEEEEGQSVEVWLDNGEILQLFADGIWMGEAQETWDTILANLRKTKPKSQLEA